jgi:hypothetical protein
MGNPAPQKRVPAQFHPVLTPILRTTLSLVEYYSCPYEKDPSVYALKRALHRAIEELGGCRESPLSDSLGE